MGIITGFIEGVITADQDGSPIALAFQNSIEEVTFNYTSMNISVDTFGADGTKGMSDSCPHKRECSFEIASKNISWALLQAVCNTLARDAERPLPGAQSFVLTAAQITSDVATVPVTWTPIVGEDILATDSLGTQYPVTFTGGSLSIGSTTVPAVAGTKVTVTFRVAATGSNNEIILGDDGVLLGEVGLYGRFFGCPDTLLIEVPRAIIQSNLTMNVNTDAASVGLTANALRNANGDYAIITKL